MMQHICIFLLLLVAQSTVQSLQRTQTNLQTKSIINFGIVRNDSRHGAKLFVKTDKETTTDVEATTEKYGLEAGIFQSIQKKDGGESAKELLQKYGVAYLATSIPLAIVSFTICYVLVDMGVDVTVLLSKVGIDTQTTDTAKTAGTAAIAYAAHKAASPLRFPPTVALTPVVAKLIGKEPKTEIIKEE